MSLPSNLSEKGEEMLDEGVASDNESMSFVSSGFSSDTKILQAVNMGKKVFDNASNYNPLKDVGSLQQLASNWKKEATACLDPREYSKPTSRDEFISRLKANVAFFRLTYGATIMFFIVYFLLTSPFLLFEIMLVIGVWGYFFKIKADQPVQLGSYTISNREKFLIAVPLTTLIALFGGLVSYLVWVALASGVVISIHAGLRKKIEPNPLDDLAEAQQEFV